MWICSESSMRLVTTLLLKMGDTTLWQGVSCLGTIALLPIVSHNGGGGRGGGRGLS
jgi:hypothetical protein